MDNPLLLAPGQRVDVAIIAPSVAMQELSFTSSIGQTPFTLPRIRSTGQKLRRLLSVMKLGFRVTANRMEKSASFIIYTIRLLAFNLREPIFVTFR
ncbi:MAG: hypothetical protein OSA51_10955 [Octadecabacter sp.]|nr:hypothetical protein [Octadecabacter sp.]